MRHIQKLRDIWVDADRSDEEDLHWNAADATQFGIPELAREELTKMEETTYEDDGTEIVDNSAVKQWNKEEAWNTRSNDFGELGD